jgi:hypothetical protein
MSRLEQRGYALTASTRAMGTSIDGIHLTRARP